MLLVTRNKFTHKNHLLLLLSEGDIKISCMYERVNINCAEVNSTRQMGSGIYFFISVLSEAESFFTKMNIHVIQCDEKIQSDHIISSAEELADYMEHMEILGGGGTDFRPAFQYVDSLIQKKAFTGLKGLIYFTDGYGMFPVKMPSYDTVFVFMRDDYSDADVPSWAMKLILGPEELDNGGTGAV